MSEFHFKELFEGKKGKYWLIGGGAVVVFALYMKSRSAKVLVAPNSTADHVGDYTGNLGNAQGSSSNGQSASDTATLQLLTNLQHTFEDTMSKNQDAYNSQLGTLSSSSASMFKSVNDSLSASNTQISGLAANNSSLSAQLKALMEKQLVSAGGVISSQTISAAASGDGSKITTNYSDGTSSQSYTSTGYSSGTSPNAGGYHENVDNVTYFSNAPTYTNDPTGKSQVVYYNSGVPVYSGGSSTPTTSKSNQQSYLENLASGGDGNATWAKAQLAVNNQKSYLENLASGSDGNATWAQAQLASGSY